MSPESLHQALAQIERDPRSLWSAMARDLDWIEAPGQSGSSGATDEPWSHGSINACWNCVDRHVDGGRGAAPAVIYDAPLIPFRKVITFAELLDEVSVFAAVLAQFGVDRTTSVVLYLPMIPRAHVAILACARLGAAVCIVPGGAPPQELTAALDGVRPQVLLTASCGLARDRTIAFKPLIDEAIDAARAAPAAVLVWQRPRLAAELRDGRDHDWEELIEVADAAGARQDCVPLPSDHPLFLAVGETASQAALPMAGWLITAAWSLRTLYGLSAGDVFCPAADCAAAFADGYGAIAPLVDGAATVCYEGELVASSDALERCCRINGVVALELSPAALRGLATEQPSDPSAEERGHDTLRTLPLFGGALDPTLTSWAHRSDLPIERGWWRGNDGWTIAGDATSGHAVTPERIALPGGLTIKTAV